MSTQTFSKVFLFPNNKRKLKTYFSYYYWAGPWKQLAHGHFRPAQTERRGRAAAWLGASAQGRPGPARSRRDATPRWRSRRHGGAGAASGPAAVAGHVRASERAHWVCKNMANPSRLLKGMEKARGKLFHGEVKRSGAMTDGGENAQGRCTLLKWCPCSEHHVPGSEVE